MQRRKFIRYTAASFLAAALGGEFAGQMPWQKVQAQTDNTLSIQWLGHTCFLFAHQDRKILVNPFQNLGCTQGYRQPQMEADMVFISSHLLDEGYYEPVRGRYKLLMESGMYQLDGLQVQGISMPHDRKGGNRFGNNIAWLWTQADIRILHLGGAAAPISLEQEILMGKPDLLFIPVGNGPKAFDPQTAKQAVDQLKPKVIVPTHYLTEAANTQECDLLPLENFLQLMPDTPVRRLGSDTLNLTAADIPEKQTIQVFEYNFATS